MANKVKGEVAFEVEGEGYVLLLDFNALCELEDELPGLLDGTAEIKSPKAIRAVFHAGLQARHPGVSLRRAGEIIHAVGLDTVADLVRQAFDASFPAKGGEGQARPPKAPASAGAGSAH
jgi:hypothetical protein